MRAIVEFFAVFGLTALIILTHVSLQTHQPLAQIVARLIAQF